MAAVERRESFAPGRLWSLWEIMINYQIFGLTQLYRHLLGEEDAIDGRILVLEAVLKKRPDGEREKNEHIFIDELITDEDVRRIEGWLLYATRQADELELQAVIDRIEIFSRKVKVRIKLYDFLAEIRALREALESGLNYKYFYKYPQDKALVLLRFPADWAVINKQFQNAKPDAEAAVDCWALGHNTASVFHLMRVAELGLRALARECRVRLPRKQVLEWADWQTVIGGIKVKADAIAGKKRGPKRDAALEFYRGSLASFEGFKDAYRNNVSHSRKSYIESEATAVREHVFHFMNRLAEKTDESGKRINWGIR